MYAYAHAPLDEETITLTSFSSGDKLYAFIRGFYGLKGLPNFFTKQMYSFFQLIDQGFALVYIDDILLLAHTKPHMLNLIEQLHQICQTNNLKLLLKNLSIFSSLSNFLDMKLVIIQSNPSLPKLMPYTN